MSEKEAVAQDSVDNDDNDEVPGYKAPEKKDIKEIIAADDEDESLRRYKEALMGKAATGETIAPFPNDQRQVIVKQLVMVLTDRDDLVLDLEGQSVEDIQKQKFVLKEGCKFKIRIDFYVQRDIVNGLKYVQKTYRLGARVDKMMHMCGTYPPNLELQSVVTPEETAPSGMLARGSYTVSSLFTDDYKNEHLKWDWNLEVKKDWSDWGPAHKAATSLQSQNRHQGHKVKKLHPTVTKEGNCVSEPAKNKASKKTKSTKKSSITQPDAKSYGYSSFL